jgi:hypothetical protein
MRRSFKRPVHINSGDHIQPVIQWLQDELDEDQLGASTLGKERRARPEADWVLGVSQGYRQASMLHA